MAIRRLAPEQPEHFAFTPENKIWCERQMAKYPPGRQVSAVLPLLWRAQLQHDNWLPKPAIELVARMLGLPDIRVLEIATFYSMFNLAPVGRYFVQLCGTTPCMLRGANDLRALLERRIGEPLQVTPDGMFAWTEVECLGACCNAPMAQINSDYYEDLNPQTMARLLDDLASGRPVTIGSQTGRVSSEFAPGKATTLNEVSLYDGSLVGAWKARFEDFAEAGSGRGATAAGAGSGAAAKLAPAAAPSVRAVGGTAEVAPPPSDGPSSPIVAPSIPVTPAATTASSAPALAPPTSAPAPIPDGSAPVSPPAAADKGAPAMADGAAAAASAPAIDPIRSDVIASAELAAREEADIKTALASLPKQASAEEKAYAVGARPPGLQSARGGMPDNLQRIKGIGKVNESKLNGLGIFHFDQIAAWSRPEIRWVGTYLSFPGRIDREDWVEQAKTLAAGGSSEKSQPAQKTGAPPRSRKE
jgi:NADH-quinone oxidoreductase subunit E